ncbi:MAG TPA: hypothetical protein VIW64_05110, partial [Pyrinomonadaceae bacterium]
QIKPQPQLDSQATFAPILKRENGLVDWSMDSFAIERRVRGFQPWPNAFTHFRSQRLIIWNAASEWIEQLRYPVGQVIEIGHERLVVACGEGSALRLFEVQLQDSRRMTARDFINGTHLKVGDVLG